MSHEIPMPVKLGKLEWLKLIAMVIVVTIGQTWAAATYKAAIEAKIQTAQTTADAAQISTEKNSNKIDNIQNSLNQSVLSISRDVAEIKGRIFATTPSKSEAR